MGLFGTGEAGEAKLASELAGEILGPGVVRGAEREPVANAGNRAQGGKGLKWNRPGTHPYARACQRLVADVGAALVDGRISGAAGRLKSSGAHL